MFDRSQFTTPRALIGLMVADKFDKLPSTTTGEIRQFTAVALTDAVPLSRDQMLRYAKDPAGAATGEVISRFILKAMIIGDANGAEIPPEQNPHRYLLNPCNMNTSADPNLVLRITKLYTTYVSSKDFNVSDGDAITIKRNDRILVTMTVDSRGNIVLDRGELTALLERAQDNKSLLNNCDALTGLFNTTTVTTLGARLGAGADAAVVNTSISPSDWLPCIEDIRPLLDFIASGEGGYNSMNQGTSNDQIVGSTHDASTIIDSNLTEMTISQVQTYQAKPSGDPKRLFAAGRYQIIPETMPSAIANSGLTNDLIFNEENQDILGAALIFGKRPIMGNYILGLHDNQHEAHLAFAQEWASVPDPTKEPAQSYYGHGNRSSHTNEQVAAALDAARSAVSTKCGAPLAAADTDSSSG